MRRISERHDGPRFDAPSGARTISQRNVHLFASCARTIVAIGALVKQASRDLWSWRCGFGIVHDMKCLLRALFFVPLLFVGSAHARSAGEPATGCTGCHSGGSGAPPVVTVTVSPTSAAPGSTATITVRIQMRAGFTEAGMYLLKVGPGTLLGGPDAGALTLRPADGSSGVTHRSPKTAANGGTITYTVQYRVPDSSTGAADFQVWALMTNNNGAQSGDVGTSEAASASVVWGCEGTSYWPDNDGDGFGTPDFPSVLRCGATPTFAPNDDDCDDNDARKNPNAVEVCNNRDDNCDGQIDEGLTGSNTFYPDADGDGYGVPGTTVTAQGCRPPAGYGLTPNDCNDSDPAVNPGATEVCNNKDDNCNGRIDEGVTPVCGVGMCRAAAPACNIDLCVPRQPVAEVCNGLDDDCDGETDEGTLCASGQLCYQGQCTASGDVPPDAELPSGSPGGAGETPSTSASGCVAGSSALSLGVLIAMAGTPLVRGLRRKKRSRP